MLFAKTTGAEKRAAFRAALSDGRLLQAPGAFAPLVAIEIERQGFDAVYISGAALSAELGLPDIGLTTLSEVAARGYQIARVTDLPAIIDVDTGFGEPMSAARTVRTMEDMGLAACHLEDQVAPKRCGHLDNKAVVETADMARRIRAAVEAKRDPNFTVIARSDARAIEGLDKAVDRMRAYADAGADMIFPEALESEAEFETVRGAIDVPLLANMTEFGKSPLLSKSALESLGYNLAIYPVTTLRLAMHAIEAGLAELRASGTQSDLLEVMQHRRDLYRLLRYEDYNSFDRSIYDFQL